MDDFRAQAMEIVTSPRVRDALDISRESETIRRTYGSQTRFLQARRLVEAGVSVAV